MAHRSRACRLQVALRGSNDAAPAQSLCEDKEKKPEPPPNVNFQRRLLEERRTARQTTWKQAVLMKMSAIRIWFSRRSVRNWVASGMSALECLPTSTGRSATDPEPDVSKSGRFPQFLDVEVLAPRSKRVHVRARPMTGKYRASPPILRG